MNNQTGLHKALHFFLIKILIGIIIIGGSVALVEWLGSVLPDKTQLADNVKNIIITIADAAIALVSYIFLFRTYEKRRISELGVSTFGKNAIIGFATGLVLQSLFILVIYITGGYSIIRVNPVSVLIFPFTAACKAGFVAEILILGVLFRITEEQFGTIIALAIITLLFAILHINSNGATFLSVCSTAMQAGFMLSAAYIFSRNLWFPIFIHFGWDFAEPGIYGAINPGLSITQTLFTSKIKGHALLTGGQTGPQNSIQALLFCLVAGILLLSLAKKKNNFINPYRRKINTNKSL